MKQTMFTLIFLVGSVITMGQNIQVGDTVMVNRSVQTYLTGEKPSLWVYNVPHTVLQVGSKYHPNGILLDINSWLSESDVSLLSTHYIQPTEIVPTEVEIVPVKVEDTIAIQSEIVRNIDTETITPDTTHKEVVEPEVTAPVDTSIVLEVTPQKAMFQTNGNISGIGGKNNAGFSMELLLGARINEYVFIGGGLGLEQLWFGLNGKSVHSTQFPIVANVKAYLPIQHTYYPHLEISAGFNMGILDTDQSESCRTAGFYSGLHARAGLGFDYKALSIGIGYQYGSGNSLLKEDCHHGYIKVGFIGLTK